VGTTVSPASAASIRSALERILASPGFRTSDRLARFLRYVVEETLEGRGDSLKETNVGVDAFARKPGYDPRIDGVVRTEAIKLRARLKEYYEGEGANDPVRIDLPKGGYVPAFPEPERPGGPVSERTVPGRWIVLAIVIFAAIGIGFAVHWMRTRAGTNPPPPPSIAVLPFIDMSAEKNQEYLCDGMTEQIIDAVSRIPNLQVVARSSVFALKGRPQDAREMGKRLNVHTVLEGSVQRSGSRVRVTAQLINTSDGFHLWSQSFDREMKDIFALEDEISHAIVDTLQVKLAAPLKPVPQADLEAFNLYLQGRYWHFQWDPADARHAITFFEKAIQKDPQYALAYSGLADSYAYLGFFRARPDDVMPKAREAAERALQLDPRLDAAYVTRAEVKTLYDHDWEGARQDFDRAFELNPSCGNAMFSRALTYLAPLGRTKEAIAEMKRARDFDPLSPLTNTYLGVMYYFDRQYDAAIEQLRITINLDPSFREAHGMLYYAYIAAGRVADARAESARIEAIKGKSAPDLDDVQVLALEGKKAEAQKELGEWTKALHQNYASRQKLACAYLSLGDIPHGLDQLELAYQEHDGMLAYAKVWPGLDPVRSEPRFQALLAKLHLAP